MKEPRIAAPETLPKELTGFDATPEEADIGSAGNGASFAGADLSGGVRELEEEAEASDILPDQLRYYAEPEEQELTAQPSERQPVDEPPRPAHKQESRPALSTPRSEKA